MYNKLKKNFIRFYAVFLIIVFLIPVSVDATDFETIEQRASYYLSSYNSYTYNAALGKVRVYFDVTGVNYMDEIGALNIKIYESQDNENWYWVDTFSYESTSGMLDYNDMYHSGYVEYNGTIGRYYKAYVCIWAGKNGDGDTRYLWTLPVKATFFAG